MSDSGELNLSFVSLEDKEEFNLEVNTLGLREMWGKYQLPLNLEPDTVSKILKISSSLGAVCPIKNDEVLYLKARRISKKQRKEILDQGPMTVKVKFFCVGYYHNLDTQEKFLKFELVGLGKSDNDKFELKDI